MWSNRRRQVSAEAARAHARGRRLVAGSVPAVPARREGLGDSVGQPGPGLDGVAGAGPAAAVARPAEWVGSHPPGRRVRSTAERGDAAMADARPDRATDPMSRATSEPGASGSGRGVGPGGTGRWTSWPGSAGSAADDADAGDPGAGDLDAGDLDAGDLDADLGGGMPASPDPAEPRPARQRIGPGRRLAGALADRMPVALRGARWQLSSPAVVGVLACLGFAVAASVVLLARDAPARVPPAVVVTAQQVGASSPAEPIAKATTPSSGPSQGLVVHVAGLVAEPGVVELPVGSRVVDALRAAGGVLPGVDTSTLNLARLLVDGEQIAVGVTPAPDAAGQPSGGTGQTSGPGPVDLNRATVAELDALPGVGPVLASRIVAWREEHGPFTVVEELLEVSGIGSATLAELSGLVRV